VKGKRGPGRPAFETGKARTGSFTVKVSDDERAEFEAAAARAGKPVTTWAREALLAASASPGQRFD
jgi:predicted HicB family RNase H-like nuclease